MALLLRATRVAQGAEAWPVASNMLHMLRGLATTSSGQAAAAQPMPADEAAAEPAQPAVARWKQDLGVIRTDWT
jgi:hypothetical protein